mmetsp:Transcript_39548/g.108953  ORF Transcript_39548/g.108953 Transcript_39548/m.108953 type:complete len:204 (-) Transcript_39548:96-707(-)
MASSKAPGAPLHCPTNALRVALPLAIATVGLIAGAIFDSSGPIVCTAASCATVTSAGAALALNSGIASRSAPDVTPRLAAAASITSPGASFGLGDSAASVVVARGTGGLLEDFASGAALRGMCRRSARLLAGGIVRFCGQRHVRLAGAPNVVGPAPSLEPRLSLRFFDLLFGWLLTRLAFQGLGWPPVPTTQSFVGLLPAPLG